MDKLMFKLIVIVITTCFSVTVFAQSFFAGSNANTAKKNAPAAPVFPPPNPVMTSDQFKTKVNTLSKQNTNAIDQRMSQQTSKSQTPTSQPPPAPKQPGDFSSLNPPPPPQTGETGQPFGTSNGLPNPRPAGPGGQQQKQGNTQNNTYTGFGTGNTGGTTNTGSGSSSGSSGGGWNIKY